MAVFLYALFAAVRRSRMAQSGHSRHRNILSAIGLGYVKTSTSAARVEIFLRNCAI